MRTILYPSQIKLRSNSILSKKTAMSNKMFPMLWHTIEMIPGCCQLSHSGSVSLLELDPCGRGHRLPALLPRLHPDLPRHNRFTLDSQPLLRAGAWQLYPRSDAHVVRDVLDHLLPLEISGSLVDNGSSLSSLSFAVPNCSSGEKFRTLCTDSEVRESPASRL